MFTSKYFKKIKFLNEDKKDSNIISLKRIPEWKQLTNNNSTRK